jgi:transcription-repair coupling factor (superfamily II helicase)
MPRTLSTPQSRDAAGWIDRIDRTDAVQSILQALTTGALPLHVHKLTGSLKALVAAAVRKHTRRSVLVVAVDDESADAVRSDLEMFAAEPALHLAEHASKPYEAKVPHTDITAARLETLSRLAADTEGIVVTTVPALMEQVLSPEHLSQSLLRFAVGGEIDLEDLLVRLTYLGYDRSASVEEVGEYAVRGGILDVYSLGGDNPLRIEVEYDTVASIREFDVHTQRSLADRNSAVVLPRHELVLDQDRIDAAVAALGAADAEAGRELKEAFEADVHPVGVERSAALLGQDLGSVLRFLPPDTVVLFEEPELARSRAEAHWKDIEDAHETVHKDFPHISAPAQLYLDPDTLWRDLNRLAVIRLSDFTHAAGGALVTVHSKPPESFGRKIDLWRDYLRRLLDRGFSVVVTCDNEGQQKRLNELLVEEGVGVELVLGILSGGFVLEPARLVVLTDHEFFGRPRRRRRRRHFRSGFGLKELQSLKPGAYVVHVDHGIGRYLGLTRLEVNGHHTDVLQIEYQRKDKLYLPVDQLHLLQKYSSEEGKVPVVSRLGGTGWDKAKSRAKKAIKEMAGELLRLYARRKAHPGYAFNPDTPWQRELEGSFPFEETPDQQKAVDEVKADMETGSPMDRLICGDVGYGKTEVAVRAAFKAIQAGKQVAMLVPTTILAEQHFHTFQERFAEFPLSVDMLSRFRTPKERVGVLERLADGRLDMVIGTHALLGKNVRFRNLGLLVVDEEQRFGVGHKEKMKQMRVDVDVLTLTATPIPRTLNLSLLGVRDITIIQTPPEGRMPVHTEIIEFDREVVREALLREADRGGQSFFVHNRVRSIGSIGAYVEKLCPQLRVGIAHGQMPERALEKVMHEFVEGRLDVLVATMIIENGLDIPSVNTMIVNRADAFGLSQLYQLRGRVGRSIQKASCYFLVPSHRALTQTAMKRLRAIAEFDELGSGFALAMRDLEIRGSGNILGAEQSGHIVTVGFEMYCRLVDEAVRELKGLPLEDRPEPRLTTDADAYLPDEYVADAEEKVGFYKRLAEARETEEVDALEEEIQDRFGKLAPPAAALFDLRRIRVLGGEARASSILIRNHKVEIELSDPPTPARIKDWMQAITLPVEFATSGRFVLRAPGGVPEALRLLTVMRMPPGEPSPAAPVPAPEKGTS